ncbi:hypothetical protein [Phosphitispora sp. TUW77]|uniref:hypothetical protein n=1 Tax=Phosphitispora sp. TUW77 TaxID=3152361 RepID=UPI003AB52124
MKVSLELHLPPEFFDSAKKSNYFESVSERIAKAIIISILNEKEKNINRGRAEIKEPDYIVENRGYEVTFAVDNTIIPQLKGVSQLRGIPFNIEEMLISDIKYAIKKKSDKHYLSATVNLIIFVLHPLLEWYSPFYIKSTPLSENGWRAREKKRNELFAEMYEKYIQTEKFKNINIVQLTHDGFYVLYDLKSFGLDSESEFMTKIGIKNKDAFPVCKTISVAGTDLPVKYETTIVNCNKTQGGQS